MVRTPPGELYSYRANGGENAGIEKEPVAACLDYARELAEFEVVTA